MCTRNNLPSVSSINRILRNRAAERSALEYAHVVHRSLYGMPINSLWPHQSMHMQNQTTPLAHPRIKVPELAHTTTHEDMKEIDIGGKAVGN